MLDRHLVALERDPARNKVVRGITLKRDEVPIEQWVRELVDEVMRSAAVGEQARVVLEGLVL